MARYGAAVDGNAAASEGIVEGGGGEEGGIVYRQIFNHGTPQGDGPGELPLAGPRYAPRVHGEVTAGRGGPYAVVDGQILEGRLDGERGRRDRYC